MRSISRSMCVAFCALVIGLTGLPQVSAIPNRVSAGKAAAMAESGLSAAAKPRATVSGAITLKPSGKVRVSVTSNSTRVKLSYRTSKNKKRIATLKIRKGKGARTFSRGSKSFKAQAKATRKLKASAWVSISAPSAVTVEQPSGNTIYPSSPILPPMSNYSTVNQYTHDYYLIRSYVDRFEAAGGGTLILGPGRYEISSTIFVPSNTTIQLSAGTTLVKSDKTGTSRFSAASSMFMLIRPSLGKVHGAVGGHNGDSNINILGAGGGQSVIDMANLYNTLAIIAGHNRGVTISGISFKRMNNNHFIEMDACAECTISNNEFLDAAGGTRETAEAINLDTPDPATKGFSSIWSNQDSTPNEGVTISGNRFDGMQRAFGTHNFSSGRYHSGIVVQGNTITNNSNDAIHIMNWSDPVFTGNTITSRSGYAGIRACGTTNPTITANSFDQSAAAVVFRTCSGENGTTRGNAISEAGVGALKANTVGASLRTASVVVPEFGTVWFNGHEPPATVPTQPRVTDSIPGDASITISWSPATADPRAPISAYRIRLYNSPSGQLLRTFDELPTATRTVISDLTNGAAYFATVSAVNVVGESSSGSGYQTIPQQPQPVVPPIPVPIADTPV